MSDLAEAQDQKSLHRPSPLAPTRPDRTLPAIALLAVMSLAGMLALLPGLEEKAEGLLAEGRYDDAIHMLADVGKDRPLNDYEGYMLFKLYMLTKRPDDAVLLLTRQPDLQIDGAAALRQISDLYRQLGDTSGEAAVLRQLYDANPTDADFARLRVLYRLTGDTAGEASLLTHAIAAGRTERVYVDRLTYLQALTPTSPVAAVWVAASGRFSDLAATPGIQIVALTDRSASPSTTSLE